jgi:hypothetical protein
MPQLIGTSILGGMPKATIAMRDMTDTIVLKISGPQGSLTSRTILG